MNSLRLEQLYKYLEEQPDDPFTLYAIATEYRNYDLGKSMQYYNQLLTNHPDYLPTYYHAAQVLAELENRDKAIETFEKGIKLAQHQNNQLALRELKNAYNELLFED